MKDIIPNTFLVGVQKAATTSVYDWISQHPEVCGPVSMKDTPFFIDDSLYVRGQAFLNKVYRGFYNNQKIIINGSAHNIYFEYALERIKQLNPEARIILVLRNPVARAISAYKFAKKRNLEKDDFLTAIEKEGERLNSPDIKVRSETTYVDHGYYYKQIIRLRKYFPPERTLILLYEDVREEPLEVTRTIYNFLGVDPNFIPELRALNKTGETRFVWIKNLIYNDSGIKRFFLKHIFDRIIPYDMKYRIKIFFLNLITSSKPVSGKAQINNSAKAVVLEKFRDDIEKLEKLLNMDLSNWKK